MIQQITDWENVLQAYQNTQKGKPKYKKQAILFAKNPTPQLRDLVGKVHKGEWEPSGYSEFTVKEPKERVIYAPKYVDKIVQHMVNNVLRDYFEPKYIKDSYACIRGRGHLACVKAIQRHMRVATRNYKEPYLIKADVSKFFCSIDRDVLKRILRKHIDCQQTIHLLDKIIDNSPQDKGLPLGNLTSQQFANIYMNEIDQYCKRTLSLKHYVRYADDIFIVVDGKKQAKYILSRLRERISDVLKLSIPLRKCDIRPLRMGFSGLGVKIKTTHIMLTSRTKRRFERGMRNLSRYNTEANARSCSSRYAHIKNFSHRNFVIAMLSKYNNICYNPRTNTIKRIKS